jgi:hypothetical protein
VVFGADTVSQAGSEVREFCGTHILVLYGGGNAVKNGLLEKVTRRCPKRPSGTTPPRHPAKPACPAGAAARRHV